MRIKKANAVLGLVTALALLTHLVMACRTLTTWWYHPVFSKMVPHLTMGLVMLHAVLSIAVFFFAHDGSDMKYPRLNTAVILQRASGVLMILLVHAHVNSYSHVVSGVSLTAGQTVLHALVELLFFAVVLTHAATSVPRCVITLGLVRSEGGIRRITLFAYILCAVLMVAAAGSMLSFFVKGLL